MDSMPPTIGILNSNNNFHISKWITHYYYIVVMSYPLYLYYSKQIELSVGEFKIINVFLKHCFPRLHNLHNYMHECNFQLYTTYKVLITNYIQSSMHSTSYKELNFYIF